MNENRIIYKDGNIEFKEIAYNSNTKRIFLDMGCEAVIIIPESKNNQFYMIKQKRAGTNKECFEFPSGGIEAGESPLEAAARELKEEIGGKGELNYIGSFQPLLGLVNLKVHVIYSRNTTQDNKDIQQEDYEKISYQLISNDELHEMIKNNVFEDGYIYAALGMINNKK